MNFNEYQRLAESTNIYPKQFAVHLNCLALGINEEAGEVAGKVKKAVRDNVPLEVLKAQMFHELGDVLWYITNTASFLGFTIEDIAKGNIDKLKDRDSRGVLGGNGDNR